MQGGRGTLRDADVLRSWGRAFVGLLAVTAAVTTGGAAARTPYEKAMGPFQAQLQRQCPIKGLDRLSPVALEAVTDLYVDSLPTGPKKRVRAAEPGSCRSSQGGVSCLNKSRIDAIGQLGLTNKLAHYVCGYYPTCNDDICSPPREVRAFKVPSGSAGTP